MSPPQSGACSNHRKLFTVPQVQGRPSGCRQLPVYDQPAATLQVWGSHPGLPPSYRALCIIPEQSSAWNRRTVSFLHLFLSPEPSLLALWRLNAVESSDCDLGWGCALWKEVVTFPETGWSFLPQDNRPLFLVLKSWNNFVGFFLGGWG